MTGSLIDNLTRIGNGSTGRASSWDTSGRNADFWSFEPGESRVLADIDGPGAVTHLWMTQPNHYREVLLKITWDNARQPSVLCPLGDFFGLGHGIVNSYQSLLFSASTRRDNCFDEGCALNSYVRMPFRERAVVELVNESREVHRQYFYIDYEQDASSPPEDAGYFHAEFRRENPFGGWARDILVNHPEANVVNKERAAWENNYVILETTGRGHYVGCNLSVTNFQGTWWGEGDDMNLGRRVQVGPPTCTAPAARTTSTRPGACRTTPSCATARRYTRRTPAATRPATSTTSRTRSASEGRSRSPSSTGTGTHLCNEMSSVAYWYAAEPGRVKKPPPVARRMPVLRDNQGNWLPPAPQPDDVEAGRAEPRECGG